MIHCRDHLINWLIKATESDVLLYNALKESGTRVELLGTFDPLPGSKNSGWLVRVTTYPGRMDLVAIVKDYLGRPDHWYNAVKPDWNTWLGPNDNVLIGGDGNEQVDRNKDRFHRITQCSPLYLKENKGTGDSKTGPGVVKKRSDPPNVSVSIPPIVRVDVHNSKAN